MRPFHLVLAAILASHSVASTAGVTKAPDAAPAADDTRKICETQVITGSRLATKRVCGTAKEWAERRLQDRQAIEKVQMQPCMLQTTGPGGRPSC